MVVNFFPESGETAASRGEIAIFTPVDLFVLQGFDKRLALRGCDFFDF
jgi:hypothetical protein